MTKEQLTEYRARLEIEYAAKRSLLDKLIDRWDREEDVAPLNGDTPKVQAVSLPVTALRLVNAQPATQSEATRKPSRRKAEAQPKGRGMALAVRRWVAQQPAEFEFCQVLQALGGTRSAVSCALLTLQRNGQIERVRMGWYRKTGRFEAPAETVADRYQRERAEMHIAPLPEVEGARPASR